MHTGLMAIRSNSPGLDQPTHLGAEVSCLKPMVMEEVLSDGGTERLRRSSELGPPTVSATMSLLPQWSIRMVYSVRLR